MSYYDDVNDFHAAMGERNIWPQTLSDSEWAIRIRLILEEIAETATAHSNRDIEKFSDGLVDIVYVVLGTASAAGLPFNELWKEVHDANMRKFVECVSIVGGKLMKPKGWVPPNIRDVLLRGGLWIR